MNYSLDNLNFGAVHAGASGPNIYVDPSLGPPAISFNGGVEIKSAPVDAQVTAHIEGDTVHFGVRDIILMEWTMEDVDPGELPPGHHGRPPQVKVLEVVGQSDGTTPLAVTTGQYVLVRAQYFTSFLDQGTLGATLVIEGDTWDRIEVPLSLFLAGVLTIFTAPPLEIVAGQSAATPILIQSTGRPIDVSYTISQTQLHSGLSIAANSFPTNPGDSLNRQLTFQADLNAPLGANTLALDQWDFTRTGLLLPVNILAPPPPSPPGPDPQRGDPVDVFWAPDSTRRICQLTGGLDPTGLPHLNDTTGFDLLGTDLGSSFDHWVENERRTYFFFGDSDGNGGNFDDAIAYTVDDDPEPNGIHLRFVMGDNQWRPLTIPGVALGKFAVPTGGFSHDGRLFVFATTDCDPDNRPFGRAMGRSVLASASDPGADFEKHYEVSNNIDDWREDGRGGGKFINISPIKINNNEWPGLPDNAAAGAQGVLVMASGKYRASAPYLAYFPLSAGRVPDKSDWRYLSGWDFWEPGFGPNGPPAWSDSESDAIRLFDADSIGELSFCWNAVLKRWLVLYAGGAANGAGILLRSSGWPWGPWSAEPQLIFDPHRDDHAQGSYMFECGPYGAYVISRYDQWDARAIQATIYYTLSNGNCWKDAGHDGDPPSTRYQVHLMKSKLELLRKP